MLRTAMLTGRLMCGILLAIAIHATAGTAVFAQEEKPYTVKNGKVDWYTFSGFRRYHSECHVCHGPDGMGSTFAPALAESLKTMPYDQYLEIVVNGKQETGATGQRVMPAFALNKNVMCFVDDIYAYLKARADGAIGRGRPDKEAKPAEATERDDACMGS